MMRIKILLVLSIFLLFGSGLFIYATFDREEREIDLNNQNIHAVLCMDGDGNLETYHINIPEGVNLDYFSEGFCKSLEEK